MTCPTCVSWCATSKAALANRLKNLASAPGSTVHSCPQCGGTDWATTRDEIKPDVKKEPWWLRWNPPSWQYLRAANILSAVAVLGLAWLNGPSYIGMVDMLVVGFTVASAFHITLQMRSRKAFNALMGVCNEMHETNRALLAQQGVHIMSIHRGSDDDSPPTAPTMQ